MKYSFLFITICFTRFAFSQSTIKKRYLFEKWILETSVERDSIFNLDTLKFYNSLQYNGEIPNNPSLFIQSYYQCFNHRFYGLKGVHNFRFNFYSNGKLPTSISGKWNYVKTESSVLLVFNNVSIKNNYLETISVISIVECKILQLDINNLILILIR